MFPHQPINDNDDDDHDDYSNFGGGDRAHNGSHQFCMAKTIFGDGLVIKMVWKFNSFEFVDFDDASKDEFLAQ
jgi:hypothetical protein